MLIAALAAVDILRKGEVLGSISRYHRTALASSDITTRRAAIKNNHIPYNEKRYSRVFGCARLMSTGKGITSASNRDIVALSTPAYAFGSPLLQAAHRGKRRMTALITSTPPRRRNAVCRRFDPADC
jgi:hypothetical protein